MSGKVQVSRLYRVAFFIQAILLLPSPSALAQQNPTKPDTNSATWRTSQLNPSQLNTARGGPIPATQETVRRRFTDAATGPIAPPPYLQPLSAAPHGLSQITSESNCSCSYCCTAGQGSWHWLRDETQELRRTIHIYNTQCVRCHGVQGKGVWDIPDVPNFISQRWQQSRSDRDIVRLTLNGRGACMPAFKGTITTDEAWALARYIRRLAQPAIERQTDEEHNPPANLPAPKAATDGDTDSGAFQDTELRREGATAEESKAIVYRRLP